jgi:hypothetical protein
MKNNRWITITAAAATAGGLAWLSKLAVIAVTDGRVEDTGAASAFFLLGAVLLAVGAGCVTLRLLRPRARWTTVAAVLPAPIVFFVSFIVLESLAKAAVGDAGPAWLEEEVGILATGAVWLATGLTLLRGSYTQAEAPAHA